MSTTPDKRIADIRAKVRDERALLSALNKQVSVDLKKLLKPASHYLDDVEVFFSRPKPYGTRSVPQVSGPDGLAMPRPCYVALRKWIESLVKKGADARAFG